jgi:hypothetical protein
MPDWWLDCVGEVLPSIPRPPAPKVPLGQGISSDASHRSVDDSSVWRLAIGRTGCDTVFETVGRSGVTTLACQGPSRG